MSASIEDRNLFGSCEGMNLAIVGVLTLRGSGYCGCVCQHLVGGGGVWILWRSVRIPTGLYNILVEVSVCCCNLQM